MTQKFISMHEAVDCNGLKQGDEVVVKAGCSNEKVGVDTTVIIAAVDGYSALTACGLLLAWCPGDQIAFTGNHFEEFELSDKAKAKLAQVPAPEE